MVRLRLSLIASLVALVLAVPVADAAPATQPVESPSALRLLKQECFSCHNAEKHKGGLVLTSREAALKGGDSGAALVPGKPGESLLLQTLSADADLHMPPKKQLTPQEVELLTSWVATGATWDDALLSAKAAERPVAYRALPEAYSPVLALAVSPDGKTLAVGRGSRVLLYEVAGITAKAASDQKPKPLAALDGPRDVVQALAWSADGRLLAAGDHARALVWEVAKPAEPPAVLEGLVGRVTAVQFLPQKQHLVVADGGEGTTARLHLFQWPKTRPQITVEAHADTILDIDCDREGKLLATGGGDKAVRLWDGTTLKNVATLEGHTARVSTVAFNPDGGQLASGSADRDVKTWDVKTRERKISAGPHPAPVTAIAWQAKETILVACEDGTIRGNPSDKKELARPYSDTADDVVYALATTGDGKAVFGGGHDGLVYVWGPNGKLTGKVGLPDAGDRPAQK